MMTVAEMTFQIKTATIEFADPSGDPHAR